MLRSMSAVASVRLQVERQQFTRIALDHEYFSECFENSLISIVDYLLGADSVLIEMSSRLNIHCNIAEFPQN